VAVVGKTVLGSAASDSGDDIFSISRDGQVSQLTHLTEHYGKLLTINPSGPSWSPDGRYIAFWLIYPSHGSEWQLAVHDTVNQKTTAYCIVNKDASQLSYIHPLPAPIWSPDSKQLMVENRYDPTSNHILIVDLAQKLAFSVFDNMYPAGWLSPGP
jgi:Tol biopolymer transport system component